MGVDKKVCRKIQGRTEPGNSCLTTPGTCESCPEWEKQPLPIRFTVYGHPEPKGSTKAFLPKGAKYPVITSDNAKGKPWAQEIAGTALDKMKGIPFQKPKPVYVTLRFYLRRPDSLAKKYRYHTKKPDVDKLARLVNDALTGIAWDDDSQIVAVSAMKAYGLPERVEIEMSLARFEGLQ